MKSYIYILLLLTTLSNFTIAQIPSIYSNLSYNKDKKLVLEAKGKTLIAETGDEELDLNDFIPKITATGFSLLLEFGKKVNGTLLIGMIPYQQGKFMMPIWHKTTIPIINGVCSPDMLQMYSPKYDLNEWTKNKISLFGYRIVSDSNLIVKDGRFVLKYDNEFSLDTFITEGPFVNNLSSRSVVISFKTSEDCLPNVVINGKSFKSPQKGKKHEINITGLIASQNYQYKINVGSFPWSGNFQTAPQNGSKEKFTFAYLTDCRSGMGGNERSIYGTNNYVIKKCMALAYHNQSKFIQFTGDFIDGYSVKSNNHLLELANFKNSISPFAAYFPVYTGVGNHELIGYKFLEETVNYGYYVDKFPFETESTEAIFASEFVNPSTELISEDYSNCDPDTTKIDFPSYQRTVYSYQYGNVAVICLNTEYWYASALAWHPETSGNPHGYIMDNQLKWFDNEVQKFEKDPTVQHIMVTLHTPLFPNGGHKSDCMWYKGDNNVRCIVAGKPVEKGIIQRRDELLDIMVNKSKKTTMILVGDEHNYSRMKISENMERYPENYPFPKLKLSRDIYQITNGAAGAPYYAQEKLPWSNMVEKFTTQFALVLVDVAGNEVNLRVLNPETMEEIDNKKIK